MAGADGAALETVTDPSQVHEVGTLAHITRLTQSPRGVQLLARSHLQAMRAHAQMCTRTHTHTPHK